MRYCNCKRALTLPSETRHHRTTVAMRSIYCPRSLPGTRASPWASRYLSPAQCASLSSFRATKKRQTTPLYDALQGQAPQTSSPGRIRLIIVEAAIGTFVILYQQVRSQAAPRYVTHFGGASILIGELETVQAYDSNNAVMKQTRSPTFCQLPAYTQIERKASCDLLPVCTCRSLVV